MNELKPKGGRLQWGIMGAGGISKKFALDAREHGIRIAAVASRDLAKAESFALEMGIPKAYGNYESILQDKNVNVIYIALPNHLHAEWSIKAAQSGKHILCEKPATMDSVELESVLHAVERAGVFFMEAFMYRLHPQWGLVQALIAEDRIGPIRSLHSSFCFDMGFKPSNIRQVKAMGGGALLDIGCYCLSFSRSIMGCEPVSVEATATLSADSGVDDVTDADLIFPGEVHATFKCAIRYAEPNCAIITGTKGRIEVPAPWHPPKNAAEVRLHLEEGEIEIYRAGDGIGPFAREALEVVEHVGNRQSPTLTWQDSLHQVQALEKLRQSAGLI